MPPPPGRVGARESDRRRLTTLAAISDPDPWRQAAAATTFAAVVVRVLQPALRRADLPAPPLGRPAEFWSPAAGICRLLSAPPRYAEAIRCLADSGVITQPLLTVSFPFGQYLHAYRYIDENCDCVMKVMIDLDRSGEARPREIFRSGEPAGDELRPLFLQVVTECV